MLTNSRLALYSHISFYTDWLIVSIRRVLGLQYNIYCGSGFLWMNYIMFTAKYLIIIDPYLLLHVRSILINIYCYIFLSNIDDCFVILSTSHLFQFSVYLM